MAKVSGPLFSVEASGKFGSALVFFPWKGINVVRQLIKPANPRTGGQGDQRLVLGGTGRACSVVKPTSDYAGQLNTLGLIPAAQTRQSYLVKKIISSYMYDATAYEAMVTEFNAHSAKTDFTSAAGGLALADFDIEYKSTANAYPKGMMLYVLAKLAIASAFTGTPYTTKLSDWTTTQITAFVADLAAAA